MAVLKSDKSLLLTGGTFSGAEEVVDVLAARAHAKGFVNETFVGNVLRREKEYPTGLATAVPIAIPHIHEGCLVSFFAMAVLEKPVPFFDMSGSGEVLMVELVFLFGIINPSEQTTVLKKFAKTFQQTENLKDFQKSTGPSELAKKIQNVFGDYISIG